LWLTVTFLFLALAFIKGNPVSLFIDPRLSPERGEQLKKIYGYDRDRPEQYLRYLGNLARGEMGTSFIFKRSVTDVLKERIGTSLFLGGMGYLCGLALCLLLLAGLHATRTGPWRLASETVLTLFLAIPSFVLAALLLGCFGAGLGWFPLAGSRTLMAGDQSLWQVLLDRSHHAVLPVLSLGLPLACQFTAYLHEHLSRLEEAPFMLSARGRGVAGARLFWNHQLRAVLPGFIQLAGIYLPLVAGGALVIEAVFGWSGMGLLLFDAALSRDYPLLLGGSIWMACVVVPGYELADVLRGIFERRMGVV
jgi:peptide/nickel transport system permease protein